jgi:hydroxymethylpyrimidine/phosphomethylpyrimidine kinase
VLPVALTIAGSDPSGGAGIQADLKTFHRFGVYGEAVVTLVTVQNTVAVSHVEVLSPELVTAQIDAVVYDIPPAAAKTGALGSPEVVRAVARAAANFPFPLVVDPVLVSKHGAPLMEGGLDAWQELLSCAALVTPNIPEAEALTGTGDPRTAARRLHDMGARAALVKGGHGHGDPTDILFDGNEWYEFSATRIETRHTHGTGCTFSAAITAGLATGLPLPDSVARAKHFVHEAIRTNPGLGRGCGPLNHHAEVP